MGTQHITPQNSLLPNIVNYPLVIDDVRGEGTRQEFILYRILKYCLVSSHTSPSCIANCLMHFNAYYDVSRLESRYFYRFDLRNRYMESVTRMHTLTHTHTQKHTHSLTHSHIHTPVLQPRPASDFHPTGLCETETPSHACGCQTRNR